MPDTAFRTRRPPGEPKWFWRAWEEDDLHGPFATEAEARDAWFAEHGQEEIDTLVSDGIEDIDPADIKAGFEWVKQWRRAAISTDVFCAQDVIETLEEANEEATYEGRMPAFTPEAERELELRLATALFDWLAEAERWKEFRGCVEK